MVGSRPGDSSTEPLRLPRLRRLRAVATLLALLWLVATVLIVYFFRDPYRAVPASPAAVVVPPGVVIDDEDGLLGYFPFRVHFRPHPPADEGRR